MFKRLGLIVIILCFLIQACKQQTANEDQGKETRVDLSKAASYNLQLGLAYLKQGDRPRAKNKLLLAYKQEPKSPDVNASLAYYYENTTEIDQAKKYYKQAIVLSENSGAQLNNFGTFLCRQGNYKEAEMYFLKAVRDPAYVNTSGAYENAGLCALAIPDVEKAKQYFNKALDQDPSRKQSIYELTKMETQAGHDKEALQLMQKYRETITSDKELLSMAKDLASKTGDTSIAAEYENSLRQLDRSSTMNGVNDDNNNNNG